MDWKIEAAGFRQYLTPRVFSTDRRTVYVKRKEKKIYDDQNIPVNPYKADFAYGLHYGAYDACILVYELYAFIALL